MRTLSAALIAKQKDTSVVPYVKFNLTSTAGVLRNGTGTATGSPVTLANGANAITVTVAGTFTVHLPYGVTGTAVTGGWTVTGSPQSLAAGSNTVIVEAGGAGSITVNITIATFDYTARVLNLEHHEEPYNDYATVVLRNDDRLVADDLRGYWVQIAYGYITGNAVADSEGADSAGNNSTAEYSYTPRLWVTSQQELSSQGNVKVILELEGMWSILQKIQYLDTAQDPPAFFYKGYTATTAYTVIGALMVLAGFTLDALGSQDDSIINTLTPVFSINGADAVDGFDTYSAIIYRLMSMTKCYLRAKTGLAFKVIYPIAGDAVNQTYYSDQQYIFSEYLERKRILSPNHVYVLWGYDSDTDTWTCTAADVGEAIDSDEIARFREVRNIILARELTSEADADNRAAAILTRAKAELLGGHLIIRHDCGIELYDKIQILDARGF